MATEPGSHGAPDGTVSTRHPTQLSVLLASAGSPPFDPQRAALAASRLFDAFVLAPGRRELFLGPQGLFGPHATGADPRHDALARLLRTIAFGLRARIEAHESLSGSRELLRGAAGLSAARIEGQLGGFDPRRGTASVCTPDAMIGSDRPGTDPLDAGDAGVLRRLLALSLRGAMVSRGARTSGLITDLGGATLVLAALDLAANPRSALRAARARLSRAGRLGEDDTAWPREVGQAIREWFAHSIASACTSGSPGRELTREPALPAELLDVFAVSLALGVYNGYAPERESPLVVPGVSESESFTAAPIAVGPSAAAVGSPVLGLFSKVDFVPLPYAPVREADVEHEPLRAARATVSRPKLAVAALDEALFSRARDQVRAAPGARSAPAQGPPGALSASAPSPPVASAFEAMLDPFDPMHAFTRVGVDAFCARLAKTALGPEPSTQIVVLVGPRTSRPRDALSAVGRALLSQGTWHVLAPRADTRTLAFEVLRDPVAPLRRADISRWIGTDLSRAVEFNVDPGANLLLNATALDRIDEARARALAGLCSDVVDRGMPRALIVLLGASGYGAAAALADAIGRHAELETSDVPLRGGVLTLLRMDAPPSPRGGAAGRPYDEAMLERLCEPFAGVGPLSELCARTLLAPAEARYRAQFARIAALSIVPDPPSPAPPWLPPDLRAALPEMQRALARAAKDSHGGASGRRALQAGVCAQHTARAGLAAGLVQELSRCARVEVALTVAEYASHKGATHAGRLEAVARAALIPWLLAANPRAALVVSDTAAELLDHEGFEKRSAALAWMVSALGGASPEALSRAPIVLSRVPGLELAAAVSVSVGAPVVATPAVEPSLLLEWIIPEARGATLGLGGSVVAALADAVRRALSEGAIRTVERDSRPAVAVLVDLVCEETLAPRRVRITVPMKTGAPESAMQTTALEIGARLAGALGADAEDDWSASLHEGDGIATEVPLSEALLTRECAARWVKGLRVLARWFPQEDRPDGSYVESPVLRGASELGALGAMLGERKIPAASEEARAIITRIQVAADEVVGRARDLAATLPVTAGFADGGAREVIERTLSVAWFLHANFCCSAPGKLQWAPPGTPGDFEVVARALDYDRLRTWLDRKVHRPDAVTARVEEVLRALGPRVLLEP
jgi:hypothetical protein